MNGETGLIQFELNWQHASAPQGASVEELIGWRNTLRALDLIGVTQEGIGYGNVSHRIPGSASFTISGTSTGGKLVATAEDFTDVTAYDLQANTVTCRGPVRASAESLSHAAIYGALPTVNAVIHVHHAPLWQQLYGKMPTTDAAALAGTKDIALSLVQLLGSDATTHEGGVVVMGGHPDGILTLGDTLETAAGKLLQLL